VSEIAEEETSSVGKLQLEIVKKYQPPSQSVQNFSTMRFKIV
jgi:hypothetical protein